jgi:putative spermidine/putrescine transport system ATP-binding protein
MSELTEVGIHTVTTVRPPTTAGNTEPIKVRGIRKTYSGVVALDTIDLDIEVGEFLTILGPSGSGKSTFLMILAGFVRPDRGSIVVAGREFVTLPPHRRDIGLVFQNYALFPHMNVAENVRFPLRYHKIPRDEMALRVRRALELVRLEQLEDRRIDQLSGGQKQRVALARALVFDPAMLLMDEPLSALDKKLREQMQLELKHLHKRIGTTTIYVTHDQREALTMSDRIVVMHQGRIVQIGKPLEVYERPNSMFVADFLGESQFAPVQSLGDGRLQLGSAVLRSADPLPQGSAVLNLMLRPEKLELLAFPGEDRELNKIGCSLKEILYRGDQVMLAVELETGQMVLVRSGTGEAAMRKLPTVGDRLTLGLHPKDTVVIPAP